MDVYVTCRELGGAAKLSLHESGKWRFAYAAERFTELFDESGVPASRLIASWYRPPEISPGLTRACVILIPVLAVCTPDNLNSKVTWLTYPAPAQTKEITVCLVSAAALASRRIKTDGFDVVGTLPLDDGSGVWILARDALVPIPTLPEKTSVHFFRGKSEQDLTDVNLRGLIVGDLQDGTICMYDARVQVARNPPSSIGPSRAMEQNK